MQYVIQEGATDVIINVVWVDKATGEYATVAHDAAGISVGYVRRGFDDVAITLAALTDPDVADDAHSDGQMGVVYNGIHRLDLPDAVCASGLAAGQKWVVITGESDDFEMLPVMIQLSAGVPGGSVDVGSIDGSASAAEKLAAGAGATIRGAFATGTLTATAATTDLTGYADDQLIGAAIVITSGPASGERRIITDYTATGGVVTFAALTTAPEDGDEFVIV